MDPSPTPQRRFSRWKTTKRTFIFDDVVNQRKSKIPKLSNVSEQSQLKGSEKEESQTVLQPVVPKPSVAKLGSHEPLKARSKHHEKSALNDLQLGPNIDLDSDPCRDQCTKNGVSPPDDDAINGNGVEGEVQCPANRVSYPGDDVKDSHPHVSKSLEKNSSMCRTSQKLSFSHHKKMDHSTTDRTVVSSGQGDISAVSTHDLTHSSSTLKRAAPNGSLNNKPAVSKHNSTVKETKTEHRRVADLNGEDSAESSSTDKENKGEEMKLSRVKRPKKDEFASSLHLNSVPGGTGLNLSRRNHSMAGPSEHDRSSMKLSSLRNRDLLTPAETLLSKRQYPYSPQSRKKSISLKKNMNRSKQMSADDSSSSQSQKSQQKTQKPKTDKSTKPSKKHSPPNPEIAVYELPTKETSKSLDREKKNLSKLEGTESFHSSSPSFSTPDNIAAQLDQNTKNENQRGRSLRNRSLMRSPESVQMMRQYPISLYYSKKKLLEISGEVSPSQSNSKQYEKSPSSKKHSPVKSKQNNSEIKKTNKFPVNHSKGIELNTVAEAGPVKSHISAHQSQSAQFQRDQSQSEVQHEVRIKDISSSKQKVPPESKTKLKSNAVSTHNTAGVPIPQATNQASASLSVSRSLLGKTLGDNRSLVKNSEIMRQIDTSVNKCQLNSQLNTSPLQKNKSSVIQSRSALKKNKSSVIQNRSSPKKNKSPVNKSRLPVAKNKSPQNIRHVEKPKVSVSMKNASINETILSSQKTPRKRNLITELATIVEVEQVTNGSGKKIQLWCPDSQQRRGSGVTAFDVILQDIETLEDDMRSAEEDDFGKRLVQRVMKGLKNPIKIMISNILEVNKLETGIKQQKVINKKLMTDLTEIEKQKQKLRGEMQAMSKNNHHKNIMLASSWMNDFRQLILTVGDESGTS